MNFTVELITNIILWVFVLMVFLRAAQVIYNAVVPYTPPDEPQIQTSSVDMTLALADRFDSQLRMREAIAREHQAVQDSMRAIDRAEAASERYRSQTTELSGHSDCRYCGMPADYPSCTHCGAPIDKPKKNDPRLLPAEPTIRY